MGWVRWRGLGRRGRAVAPGLCHSFQVSRGPVVRGGLPQQDCESAQQHTGPPGRCGVCPVKQQRSLPGGGEYGWRPPFSVGLGVLSGVAPGVLCWAALTAWPCSAEAVLMGLHWLGGHSRLQADGNAVRLPWVLCPEKGGP